MSYQINMSSIRLRFAPSPTGFLHVGGLRTALYNYFFAKQSNGKLILRIEDTDQNRLVKNAEQDLIDMLLWAGIKFDEGPHIGGDYGPYRQSERLSLYKDFYCDLIKKNQAYPCFYSNERLADLASGKLSTEDATIEDSIFKDFDLEAVWNKMKNESFVIRFKISNNEWLVHHDLIKGEVNFDLNLINDPIIIKSDGFPTYHFANVIDDHLMGITHVIRGEEWLPSIPKHIALYKAFGWEVPQFGHLPLLLNSDKTKLSKRKNDVSVSSYIEKGYTKEALINFLSLLGWHEKGDREIYSLEELTQSFSFDRVNKSGAVFDVQKLNSFNNYYIKNYPLNELKNILVDFSSSTTKLNDDMIELVKDKVSTLNDFEESLKFLFLDSITLDSKNMNYITSNLSVDILKLFLKELEQINNDTKIDLSFMIKNIQNNLKCSPKDIWRVLRLSLTGESHGPSLQKIVNIYGLVKVQKLITAYANR
tara:strand:- start:346 stop:1779 length:1434 start_codon:yes stop_codon:yes gene_type:complete